MFCKEQTVYNCICINQQAPKLDCIEFVFNIINAINWLMLFNNTLNLFLAENYIRGLITPPCGYDTYKAIVSSCNLH